MNLEVINKWLDEEYGCSYTKLEELHDFYFEKYCDLQQENKKLNGAIQTYDILLKSNIEENQQLKIQISAREEEYKKLEDNWNYIKKMLKEARQEEFNINGYCGTCTDVDIDFLLDKMHEIEGSNSNVKD